MKTIGVSSDGLVKVLDIEHGVDDYVLYQFKNDKVKRAKVHYEETEDNELFEYMPYFKVGKLKYYFNEITRCNV